MCGVHFLYNSDQSLSFQEVLTQLTTRLSSQLNDLTVQVVKEDWTLTSSSSMTPSIHSPTGINSNEDPLPNPGGSNPIAQRQISGLLDAQEKLTLPSQVHTDANQHTHDSVIPKPHHPTAADDGAGDGSHYTSINLQTI